MSTVQSQNNRRPSRRAVLTAALSAAAPLMLPSGVLARQGRPGASDRVVTAHIGLGPRGRRLLGLLRDNAAALCDPDAHRARDAAQGLRGPLRLYTDYRRVLDRSDIDAVVICTPDHWHAVQAVHAIEAGKDVYLDAPLAKTPEGIRAVVDAAARYGAVVQCGLDGRWTPAVHAVRSRANGMANVRCYGEQNAAGGDLADQRPVPEHLNWDLWLGPAPWRPYNPGRIHGNWRWLFDYGGGNLNYQGVYALDTALWCVGNTETGPVHIEAHGPPPRGGLWECPETMEVRYRFEASGLAIDWIQQPPANDTPPFGVVFQGAEEEVVLRRADAGATSNGLAGQEPADNDAVPAVKQGIREWLDCIASRKRPSANPDAAARSARLCALGNLAWRLGRPLRWNETTGALEDDPGATRLLHSPRRPPWGL